MYTAGANASTRYGASHAQRHERPTGLISWALHVTFTWKSKIATRPKQFYVTRHARAGLAGWGGLPGWLAGLVWLAWLAWSAGLAGWSIWLARWPGLAGKAWLDWPVLGFTLPGLAGYSFLAGWLARLVGATESFFGAWPDLLPCVWSYNKYRRKFVKRSIII